MTGKQISILKAHLGKYLPQDDTSTLPAPAFKPSLERAAFVAMGRAARTIADMPIHIKKITRHDASLAELQEFIPEHALLAICEAPEDRFGLAALSIEAMTSIIEMQAYGRIAVQQTDSRRPTRADATLSIGFIDMLLASLGGETLRLPEGALMAGYRYVAQSQDTRSLDLMLDEGRFCALEYDIVFGHEVSRQGKVIIALPLASKTVEPGEEVSTIPALADLTTKQSEVEKPHPKVAAEAAPVPQATHRSAALTAPIPLRAVLYRKKISLAELRALKPGSTITIPKSVLEEARLEARDGMLLAKGKLGEDEGFHALRVRPIMDSPKVQLDVQLGAEPPIEDLTEPDQFRLHSIIKPVQETPLPRQGPEIAG